MQKSPSRGVLTASGPPLDYSYKELRTCMDVETEEPRGGGKKKSAGKTTEAPAGQRDEENAGDAKQKESAAAGAVVPAKGNAAQARSGSLQKIIIQTKTIAVRLDNNSIENLTDLPPALDFMMENPLTNLQFIDLSFNLLTRIDPLLTKYTNLKVVYLHGNKIKNLPSVERLKSLPKLISLTLNGNPIEAFKTYRCFVVGCLPNLRSLDHATITDDELEGAHEWYKMHLKREKLRKAAMEDAYLASMADG